MHHMASVYTKLAIYSLPPFLEIVFPIAAHLVLVSCPATHIRPPHCLSPSKTALMATVMMVLHVAPDFPPAFALSIFKSCIVFSTPSILTRAAVELLFAVSPDIPV